MGYHGIYVNGYGQRTNLIPKLWTRFFTLAGQRSQIQPRDGDFWLGMGLLTYTRFLVGMNWEINSSYFMLFSLFLMWTYLQYIVLNLYIYMWIDISRAYFDDNTTGCGHPPIHMNVSQTGEISFNGKYDDKKSICVAYFQWSPSFNWLHMGIINRWDCNWNHVWLDKWIEKQRCTYRQGTGVDWERYPLDIEHTPKPLNLVVFKGWFI
jgi:hypothetical protein